MFCINCGDDHSSISYQCPELIIKKEIRRIKVTQKVSFDKAKNLVKCKRFVQPRIGFTEVASKAVAPKNVADLEPCKSSNSTKLFSFNGNFR